MVIINTSATDVSIQAVSPEFGVHFSRILPPQAGGPASSANAVPPNASQRSAMPNRTNADVRSFRRACVPFCIVDLQVPVTFCFDVRMTSLLTSQVTNEKTTRPRVALRALTDADF